MTAADERAYDMIVIVEDNDDHFHVMGRHLARTEFGGLPVTRCRSFAEFSEICAEGELDTRRPIILCDQTLGDSHHTETIRSVLEVAPESSVVLVVTSLDYGSLANEVLQAGAQDYLIKYDLNPRRLERSIRSAIHRKQLVNNLRRAYRDAESFAKLVAHDLKSPLATATMELSLLREASKKGKPITDEELGSVAEELRRSASLVDQMLRYARSSWEIEEVEPLCPDHVVREVVSGIHDQADLRDAEIEVAPLPRVIGNAPALGQIFQNLIANAIMYNEASVPWVRVSGVRSSGKVRIAVSDNGIGVPESVREKIFDLGFRGTHTRGGSGLGLAICRRLAIAQGGQLRLIDSEGPGTTFELVLPAAPEQ